MITFEEFKEMHVSEAASRLQVDMHELWSFLVVSRGWANSPIPPSPSPLPPHPGLPTSIPRRHTPLSQQVESLSLVEATAVEKDAVVVPDAAHIHRIEALESQVHFLKHRLIKADSTEALMIQSAPNSSVRPSSKDPLSCSDAVSQWLSNGLTLSDEVIKESAASAVAYLGPLTASLAHYSEQIDETDASLSQRLSSTNVRLVTRLEKRLADLKSCKEVKRKELGEAIKHLQDTTWGSARQLAARLDHDRREYADAMLKMTAEHPDVLEEINTLAAKLHNIGPMELLEEGYVVENGQLERVRVEALVEEDTYDVAFWSVVDYLNSPYDEGFETSKRRVARVKRCAIYAENAKKQQKIPDSLQRTAGVKCRYHGTGDLPWEPPTERTVYDKHFLLAMKDTEVCRRRPEVSNPNPEVSSKDPAFLMLLYAAAESSLERLRRFCDMIQAQVSGATAIVPPAPKKMARAFTKTLEKYRGDFSKLTDLARATINCSSLLVLREVLKKVGSEKEAFTLVLVKNRLMFEYNADDTGGYRDLLLNLVDVESGHIVELQLTVALLLAVKMHGEGGHVAYNVARMINLFDESVNVHKGALTQNVFKGIENGLLRVLECGGKATALGYRDNFDRLLTACKSEYCGLVEIRLDDVDWPAKRSVTELLEILMANCKTLECLWITDDAVSGVLPPALFEHLPKLRKIKLQSTSASGGPIPLSLVSATALEECNMWGLKLSGRLSPDLGKVQSLKLLWLYRNSLVGPIPKELGNLDKLRFLSLKNNSLSGEIPEELGRLQNLENFDLNWNSLSGPLPKSFGNLKNMLDLRVCCNKLTGSIPEELGELKLLRTLYLYGNQLSGEIPASIGRLEQLERLDLSKNSLTGPIPHTLGNLRNLVSLCLNKNNLAGDMPVEIDLLNDCLRQLRLKDNPCLRASLGPKLLEKKAAGQLELSLDGAPDSPLERNPTPPRLSMHSSSSYASTSTNDGAK